MAMLCFDLRLLDVAPIAVDGHLDRVDPVWKDEDARPVESVHVSGRVSAAGVGRYYFSGHVDGRIAGECRRCLTPVEVAVREEVHGVFAEVGDEEMLDDPDVYPLDTRADELDLRPAIREQWLLAVPAFVQCREDCKGLCPTCGTDRNLGACSCPPSSDSRWDALRVSADADS